MIKSLVHCPIYISVKLKIKQVGGSGLNFFWVDFRKSIYLMIYLYQVKLLKINNYQCFTQAVAAMAAVPVAAGMFIDLNRADYYLT